MLPLTKTLHPDDYADLVEELQIVDRHFASASPQHAQRRFEYGLALRAIREWRIVRAKKPFLSYDVGGAGSPFRFMHDCTVIDPDEPSPNNYTLEQFTCAGTELADIVTCLSVLEHVDDLDRFLYHLGCLVAPGGLLFLTMDACGCPSHAADMEIADPADQHHFHWMRRRMFGEADRRWVAERLLDFEFQWFGDRDPIYHGDHVYDYSFASLCLRKRA